MKGVVLALVLGAVLGAAAWVAPGLVGDATLADRLLQQSYKLPELVSAYIPDLLQALRQSFLSPLGTAVFGFVIWIAALRVGRPTGPGQVAQGWRPALWAVLAASAAVGTFALVSWTVLGPLDTVDGTSARWLAFGCAAAAPMVFWLMCLLGTEPMMRPAVPVAARLGGTVGGRA